MLEIMKTSTDFRWKSFCMLKCTIVCLQRRWKDWGCLEKWMLKTGH